MADPRLLSGPLDLSGPVGATAPPPWLISRLERGLPLLGSPPEQTRARRAVAERHDRSADQVLLCAGAQEVRALLGRAWTGDEVVVVRNPCPLTGAVRADLQELCDGRVVVVDESLMDVTQDQTSSLVDRDDLPGLVVLRDLGAAWGLTGLRAGYLIAAPDLVVRLAAAQPDWPLSSLALVALETCSARGPVAAARKLAAAWARERADWVIALERLDVEVAAGQAPVLLCRVPGRTDLPDLLAEHEVVVRRHAGASGTTPEHWGVAVRDSAALGRLVTALASAL